MSNTKDSRSGNTRLLIVLKQIFPVLCTKGNFISGLSSEPSAQLTSDMLLFVRGLGDSLN